MLKQRCPADMSNPSEQIVPKRIGKFVTFSQECDNPKKDLENAIVFPKTKAPEKVVEVVFRKYSWSPEYPQAEEVIDLPYTQRELRDDIKYDDEVCMPSSSRKIEDFHSRGNPSWAAIRRSRCCPTTKRLIKLRKADESQMKVIYKKLKHIHQRKQMDDLTALCKEKMSISTKETEKMDEDSND